MATKRKTVTAGIGHVDVPVIGVNGGRSKTRLDALAVEEPLEIRIRISGQPDRSVVVTMRTPGNDVELAVGFLFGEGLIASADELRAVRSEKRAECGKDNVVIVEPHPSSSLVHWKPDRNFYATSSCGVCGKASIEAIERLSAEKISGGPVVPGDVIRSLPDKLAEAQDVFARTGGLHAAGLFAADGRLIAIREDVGRHNALDKLIGSSVMKGRTKLSDEIVLLSGRASFELIQKGVVAQIPIIAAVGAPSSLAVTLAKRFGITLVGFVRDERFNVYTNPHRLLL